MAAMPPPCLLIRVGRSTIVFKHMDERTDGGRVE